jgi:predicted secreted Zn-dependent protease
MDARTGSIDKPTLEAPAPAKAKWYRRLTSRSFSLLLLLGFVAVVIAEDIYLYWRQQYWLDSANIPWSAGDIAAMQHGSARAAAAIPAFRGIPNVTVSYYDIHARDVTDIRWGLYAEAIRDRGKTANALTTWRYNWHWKPLPDGSCGVRNATVDFRAHITLPRIADPSALTPEAAQLWRTYEAQLIEHEAHHLRDAYAGRAMVLRFVRHSNCAWADRAGQSAIDIIQWRGDQFDRDVASGKLDGPVFPHGSRIPRGGWFGPADY